MRILDKQIRDNIEKFSVKESIAGLLWQSHIKNVMERFKAGLKEHEDGRND